MRVPTPFTSAGLVLLAATTVACGRGHEATKAASATNATPEATEGPKGDPQGPVPPTALAPVEGPRARADAPSRPQGRPPADREEALHEAQEFGMIGLAPAPAAAPTQAAAAGRRASADDGIGLGSVGALGAGGLGLSGVGEGGGGYGAGVGLGGPGGGARAEAKKKAALDNGAEAATWKRSTAGAHAARIAIGDHDELPLRAAQIKVQVDGHRARVVLDEFFENDRDRAYEGNFQLRLPEEASPYFFAFGEHKAVAPEPGASGFFLSSTRAKVMSTNPELLVAERAAMWTAPKEARMVPKEKAALAYADTVRRSVDPALLEWSGAGVFQARVFPLTAHHVHHVVLGYDVNLQPVGDELEYRLDLPDTLGGKTASGAGADVVVDVVVAKGAGTGLSLKAGGASVGPVPDGDHTYFRVEGAAARSLVLRQKAPTPAVLTGASYFAANVRPDLPAATGGGFEQAVYVVDTSLTASPDAFNVWLKLMGESLKANRSSLKRFAVLFFNVEARWWRPRFVENTEENVAALLGDAGSLALEGATDLGSALGEAAQPAWLGDGAPTTWDTFLLSDGAATWGEADNTRVAHAFARTHRGPLFAYQTGMAGSDVAALSELARESGGAVFSVAGENEVAKAATAHRTRPFHLVGVSLDGTSDVLLGGRPRALYPGQPLTVVGRGAPVTGAPLVLTLQRDGQRLEVKVPLGGQVPSSLAPRAYGQVAVRQLEELDAATEPVAKAYATHFRVVGKTCSLLMLDSEADYARYGIRPEADAQVVREQPAGAVVTRALDAMANSLGDPKVAFLLWLERLQSQPGVTLRLPPGLREALARMPVASFQAPSAVLATRSSSRADVPSAFREGAIGRRLDYDGVTAEARRRFTTLGAPDALKAMSSLVELHPGDTVLARDVAFSAMAWGLKAPALHLLGRVATARPYEPQTYRAMAGDLAAMGQGDLALAYFEVGLAGQWDGRFGDFHKILAVEYLHFLRDVAGGTVKVSVPDFARSRLAQVADEVDVKSADLVVLLTWNTDNTDVDLHVTEPTGEECFYSHRETRSGGSLSQDVTRGFGPEMYVLKRASAGAYRVRAHYFASDRNRESARTKVYATVIEGWGTSREKVTERVVTLEEGKEMHDVAVVRPVHAG